MKHLYETIFNQGDAIPWLNMRGLKYYLPLLDKMKPFRQKKEQTKDGNWVQVKFNNIPPAYTKLCKAVKDHCRECTDPVIKREKSGTPHGCWAFIDHAGSKDGHVNMMLVNIDTKTEIDFKMTMFVPELLYTKNTNPDSKQWWPSPQYAAAYEIDPLLIDAIKDILIV